MNILFLLFFGLSLIAGDNGSAIDPDGFSSDAGVIIDPNGGRTSLQSDQGSMIDPDGARSSAAQGDKGLGIDPNG